MTLLGIFLVVFFIGYVWLQPQNNDHEDFIKEALELANYNQNNQQSFKEQWLYAMSTPAQRSDWKAFRKINDTLSREDMVDQFIRLRGLIDWSQAPINQIKYLHLYSLLQPGDTSIIVKGDLSQPEQLTHYDTSIVGKPAPPFFSVRLVLVYNNTPVIIKPDGYYIKSPYQTKASKVVKGGEQLLKLKIVVEQKP